MGWEGGLLSLSLCHCDYSATLMWDFALILVFFGFPLSVCLSVSVSLCLSLTLFLSLICDYSATLMWAFALILVFCFFFVCLPACLPASLSVCLSVCFFKLLLLCCCCFCGEFGSPFLDKKRLEQRYPAISTSDKCMQYFHLSQQRKLSVAGKNEGTQVGIGHAPLNITLVMLLWHVALKMV